jgi:Dolichyl-phosphate-mannose-protein mannosyltransferase
LPSSASGLRAVPAWAWLAAIVVVSTLYHAWLTRKLPGPFIMVDELIYSELARSFAQSGHFLVRDVPTSGYGVVYPVLISPAYRLFSNLPQAYAAAKAINSLLMSLAAVPAYLLARRLVGTWWSLLAALLTVTVPSTVYTSTLMTENVFYPLFLLVALVLVLALERPTLTRQAALLALAGLAFATRAQALAFVPAVLVAPLLLALFERRDPRAALRPFAPLYGIAVVGGLAVIGGQLARGRSLRDLLGAYAVVGDRHYDVVDVFRVALWHAADLDLYLGVIPFAALLLLVFGVRREGRATQAFLAAALSLAVFFTFVAAAFASQFTTPQRIEERNLFYVGPLFLIALLVWAHRSDEGARQPIVLRAGVAVTAALLPLAIPFQRLIETGITSDTLALIPVWTSYRHLLAGSTYATVGLVCAGLGVLWLAVPRRAAVALPLVVLAWFALLFEPIFHGPHGFEQASAGAVFQGIYGVRRDWIDKALPTAARVPILWSGPPADRFIVNQNEFFNRSIGQVYYTDIPTPGGLYEKRVTFAPSDGLARTADGKLVRSRYLVTDAFVTPDGRVLARDRRGTTLWQLRGPLVQTVAVRGLYPDGWSGKQVSWTRRRCRGGTVVVTLEGDPKLFRQPNAIEASSAGRRVRTVVPVSGRARLRVPLPDAAPTCTVRFTIARTLVPRDVQPGNRDDRPLGTHFRAFDYHASR